MKSIFMFLAFCTVQVLCAQSSYHTVYNLLQTKCATSGCHDNVGEAASLNLEGIGVSATEKMADVYSRLWKVVPQNAVAQANKNFLVYPGNPDKSFLFRKINNGLAHNINLEAQEGALMPVNASPLEDKEIELVRQWILFGAPNENEGDVFDVDVVNDFYDNGGISSVTNVPEAPPEDEGFQIHMGPFFLPPNGEVEYFSKYETQLDLPTEIIQFETYMGDFSHHFIIYDFSSGIGGSDPSSTPYGLRHENDFNKAFVLTEQFSNTLALPQGTAFSWEADAILDLNSHYINYSSTEIMACEVYVNVYTQPEGTAHQIMQTQLIPETDIPIPNNNELITFTSPFFIPALNQSIYIWGVGSHTHKYGKDFNIYRRLSDGSRGEQIYDAGCGNGIPGCSVEEFDYQHLPIRFFDPFLPVVLNEGAIAEATFQNDGPVSVNWGFTSEDEMMLFLAYYTNDTAGITFQNGNPVGINETQPTTGSVFYPNPMTEKGNVVLSNPTHQQVVVEIVDITGKIQYRENEKLKPNKQIELHRGKMNPGVYFYRITSPNGIIGQGKFIVK